MCVCFQAPLMAPSSLNEDVLDLEQVSLQEDPLPPPIQRVMDPGQLRCAALRLICAPPVSIKVLRAFIFWFQASQTLKWQ